jgi:hypothetical protein
MVLDCGKGYPLVRTSIFTLSKLKKIIKKEYNKLCRYSGQAQPEYAGTAHGFCMQIAVIGHAQAVPGECGAAYAAGRTIAGNGAVLVCGGLGGVMEAACRGAKEAGGTTVGILPGTEGGNPHLDITIRTGLGHARNILVVLSADAVIAVGGSYGYPVRDRYRPQDRPSGVRDKHLGYRRRNTLFLTGRGGDEGCPKYSPVPHSLTAASCPVFPVF